MSTAPDELHALAVDALLASWSVADDPTSRAVARRAAERSAAAVLPAVLPAHARRVEANLAEEFLDPARAERDAALAALERARRIHANSPSGHDYLGENLSCAMCAALGGPR